MPRDNTATAVALDHVSFRYEAMEMQFDFDISAGEFVIVLGPSGAGKSTLLNLIAGFDRPTAGKMLLMGEDVGDKVPADRPVTTLFQEGNLFPHLTVAENVALGLHPGLRLSPQQWRHVTTALDRMGLAELAGRWPRHLSGGERQRVALARSLVRNRPILLLDEPFAALDPGRRREMTNLVRALAKDRGLTVVMVSHQLEEVRNLNVRALFVHDGRIIADGPMAGLLSTPASAELRAYLGQ
ncbi:MAG: thiamine ABC transporter ATP-binding protein, partial [Pseudomonadota bacterium]